MQQKNLQPQTAQQQNPEQTAALRLASATGDFQALHEIVAKARQNLNQNDWDYIVGAAETETTLRRNRLALDSIAFRPRVLRDVSRIDTSVEVFGRRLRLPVLFAPVGSLESFHEGAAADVVRAAGEFGVGHMLSSVCEPGLEKVAQAAPDALRFFQLYVRGDEAWVDDYAARAVANGYSAFCLTVDTAIYSRRERDIAKRHIVAGRRRASGREFQAALDWRTVERLKKRFDIPLAIKGIATAEDVKIALDHGVAWIYVSNHGGRQLDHGRGARSSQRPMSDNAILAAMRRMGIAKDEMSGHGFRAMARTILDEVLGFRPDFIEHQLAHAVRDPNGRAYNRTAHLAERRKMMQAWADYLDKLKNGADVIPILKAG